MNDKQIALELTQLILANSKNDGKITSPLSKDTTKIVLDIYQKCFELVSKSSSNND